MVSEGTNLGALAQQFYKKPVALGGGGNSFNTSEGALAPFTIPANLASSPTGPGLQLIRNNLHINGNTISEYGI